MLSLIRYLLVFFFVIAATARPTAADEPDHWASAMESITADELRSHVDVLADDTFEGREAGTRGGRAAGGYLVDQFRKLQLTPAGEDGSYFQSFGSGYRNILGYIEGRDPELKKQFILLGAHYDHVGYGTWRNSNGPTGYIHNGADDNASGSAGLLEVVEALQQLPERPARSVLIALWDGEEKGLLGSKHWVANPTIRLERIALAINVDMIGRMQDRELEVYGTRTGWGLRQLVSRRNAEQDLRLDFNWDIKANSDHYPFYRREIPVLMLHTGLHDDYHRPSDDAHRINAEGMRDVARLLFGITAQLADDSELTGFRNAGKYESMVNRRRAEKPPPPAGPRLGVWWSSDDEGPGLLVTRVIAGSPAATVLRPGDRLLRFGDYEVADGTKFRLTVLASTSPVKVQVEREGADEPFELDIELDGNPVRLGITYRQDDAEPGAVTLSSVMAGSAAHFAGLQVGDRIYAVAEQKFADGSEFLQLVQSARKPIMMLVERDGKLQEIAVDVLE